jgi:cytidylate kinase
MGTPADSIITIDGPVASGKSTVARELARRLGYRYLDTGAMYRALTVAAQRAGIDLNSSQVLIDLLAGTRIRVDASAGRTRVFIDGDEVTEAIRTPEVTELTRFVAGCGPLRSHMVERQREFARGGGVVAEGRDIGTVVFPDAPLKFYLDASLEERVRRRVEEWKAKGLSPDADQVRRDVQERDRRDQNRPVSPLRVPQGALVIDSTGLTVAEVVERMLAEAGPLLKGEAPA